MENVPVPRCRPGYIHGTPHPNSERHLTSSKFTHICTSSISFGPENMATNTPIPALLNAAPIQVAPGITI